MTAPTVTRARPEASRWTVVVVLAVVVAVQLASSRHLLRLVSWPNDLSFHHSMVDWAAGRLRAGGDPMAGWYPRLSAGLPQFRSYQSLPHVLTAMVGLVVGPEAALHGSLWLLLGTWPIPVYLGGRALGLDRSAGLAAAVVALLVRSATGYGFEPFSYLWLGNGLWSQAWGMWTAPLALGWSAAAVRDGRGMGRAVAATALTVAFHLPTAWFVLIALGLWVVVHPARWRRSVPRAAGIGLLSLAASAWMLVPFLADRWATNASSFNGQGDFADSFGWRRVGGWMLAGDVLDAGRIPVLSIVAGVGLVVALRRWRGSTSGVREVVAVAALALVLFVGRDPFGPAIALLPGSSEVFLHRSVAPLQLGMVWLAGIAAAELLTWISRLSGVPRLGRAALAGALVLIVLAGPVRSTGRLLREDARWVARQGQADATAGRDAEELVAIAEARGGGRVFAGLLSDPGAPTIGDVPGPIWLAHEPVDSIGFSLRVSALSADLESYLDGTSVADLDGFGVRYVLVRDGQRAPAGCWFLAARGDLQLWEVPGDGLISTSRLLGPPKAVGRDELAAELLPLLRAQGGSPAAVRLLDLEGRSPAAPVHSGPSGSDPPGRVRRKVVDLDAGRVDADVSFEEPGVLVVKANWNPGWKAEVDGVDTPVVAVAPTWLAVPVSSGRHHVRVIYVAPGGRAPLVALAFAAVALGAVWSRRPWRARRGPRSARRRRARPRVAALVVIALAGCGAPHRLPAVGVVAAPPDGPLAAVDLRRSDSFATLDRVLAPTTRTVLVVAGPAGHEADLLTPLAAGAAGDGGFSVLVLDMGAGPDVAEAASTAGVDRWTVDDPAALRRSLGLGGPGGVVVVDQAGHVVRRWPASAALDEIDPIIQEARR